MPQQSAEAFKYLLMTRLYQADTRRRVERRMSSTLPQPSDRQPPVRANGVALSRGLQMHVGDGESDGVSGDDHDRAAGEALRRSPVAKAQSSPVAKRKAASKLSDAGQPVCSFRSLLRHLAGLTRNTVRFGRDQTTLLFTAPTPVQQRAFDALGIALHK
jgi:hypothetical protein